MRLDEYSQTQLYEEYWQDIERAFGRRYRTEFDKFVKDFLTLQMRPRSPLKAAEIHPEFRSFFSPPESSVAWMAGADSKRASDGLRLLSHTDYRMALLHIPKQP